MTPGRFALSSLTMQGLIITLLMFVKTKFEINVTDTEIESAATWIAAGVGGLMIAWGRYRKGDLYLTPGTPGSSSAGKNSSYRDGFGPPMIALPLLMFAAVAMVGCASAGEDRGSWGDQRSAIVLNFIAPPTLAKGDNENPIAGEIAELEKLTPDAAATAVAKEALANAGGHVVIINGLTVNVTNGSEAASRDSGGSKADGPTTSASLPMQVNAGGGAGTQGQTSTSSVKASDSQAPAPPQGGSAGAAND